MTLRPWNAICYKPQLIPSKKMEFSKKTQKMANQLTNKKRIEKELKLKTGRFILYIKEGSHWNIHLGEGLRGGVQWQNSVTICDKEWDLTKCHVTFSNL